MHNTVEPPNKRHIGGRDLVLIREAVPTRWLTSKPHPQSLGLIYCGVWLAGDQISDYMQTHSESTQDGANPLKKY